jgi:uncharacterized phiE125 gp8 family phage protein
MAGFISLADAKAHLVVEHDADDALIAGLIDAASAHAEARTGYVAETRTESFVFDRFGRELELRARPINADTIAVSYLDGTGELQPFTDFRAVQKHGTVRLVPAIGSCWPATACTPGAVTITADVGFGATEEAGAPDAPDGLKHAVRLCIGSWYLDREAGQIPAWVNPLLEDVRARRV